LVRPTLFVNVDNAMTIAQEEIFGPVLAVIPFDGEDAIRIANDSPYGLAGNVMAGSLEHALAVARRLRAGFVGVNGGVPYGADTPFGGYKASGVGRQTTTRACTPRHVYRRVDVQTRALAGHIGPTVMLGVLSTPL